MDPWQTPGAGEGVILTAPVTVGERLEWLQASLAALAGRVEPSSWPYDSARGGPGALPGLVDAVRQAFAQPLAGDDDAAHSGTRREHVERLGEWIATLRNALVAQLRRVQRNEDAPSPMDESVARPRYRWCWISSKSLPGAIPTRTPARGCVTRNTILSLACRLGQSAQKRWRRLRGYQWLDELERGVTFIEGVARYDQSDNHWSAA